MSSELDLVCGHDDGAEVRELEQVVVAGEARLLLLSEVCGAC